MSSAESKSEAVTTPVPDALSSRYVLGPRFHVLKGNQIELNLSDEAVAALNRLLLDTGDSPKDLFLKALGLYRLAVDAKKENKAVGSAPSADVLDTEFTGF